MCVRYDRYALRTRRLRIVPADTLRRSSARRLGDAQCVTCGLATTLLTLRIDNRHKSSIIDNRHKSTMIKKGVMPDDRGAFTGSVEHASLADWRQPC